MPKHAPVKVIKPQEEITKPVEEQKLPYVTPVLFRIGNDAYLVNATHLGKSLPSGKNMLSSLQNGREFRRLNIDIKKFEDHLRMNGEKDALAYARVNSEPVTGNPITKAKTSGRDQVVSVAYRFEEETKPLDVLKTAPKKT